jgi:tetratricopeptide (TPR) repeat protein
MHRVCKIAVSLAAFSLLGCSLTAHAQTDRWQTLVHAGTVALKKRQFLAAKKSFNEALREAKRSGPADARVSESYKLLGDFYFAQQNYDEAKLYYSRSEALGGVSRNLQAAEQDLAAGAFELARQAAATALWGMEASVGRQDPLLAPCLILLARADKGLLKWDDA